MKIMIINSDKYYVETITSVLSSLTKNISCCSSLIKAVDELSNDVYDFVITDFHLLNKELSIRSFIEANPNIDLIIVTTRPSYTDGSMSILQGARGYINFKLELYDLPHKITSIFSEKSDRNKLKENLARDFLLDSNNTDFNKMLVACEKVAKSKANILLIGESGTGKEVAAKYIHLCSPRCVSSFVPVNCSAFTETLLESELFGYEQGAFTGANKSKQGRFEFANKGTLFLDEVGDVNLTTQVKLLRVLETKKVERIGSNTEKLIDFRLVSATNKDLLAEVENKSYREDFFYRISTIVIRVPSLRERREDIDKLIKFFLERSQAENDITIKIIEPEPLEFLYTYDYPGNIRELKSIIDRMVILSVDGSITKDGIPILRISKNNNNNNKDSKPLNDDFDSILTLKEFKRESESKYLNWLLSKTGGNVAEAARKLEISSRQLFNKINEYNLKK